MLYPEKNTDARGCKAIPKQCNTSRWKRSLEVSTVFGEPHSATNFKLRPIKCLSIEFDGRRVLTRLDSCLHASKNLLVWCQLEVVPHFAADYREFDCSAGSVEPSSWRPVQFSSWHHLRHHLTGIDSGVWWTRFRRRRRRPFWERCQDALSLLTSLKMSFDNQLGANKARNWPAFGVCGQLLTSLT